MNIEKFKDWNKFRTFNVGKVFMDRVNIFGQDLSKRIKCNDLVYSKCSSGDKLVRVKEFYKSNYHRVNKVDKNTQGISHGDSISELIHFGWILAVIPDNIPNRDKLLEMLQSNDEDTIKLACGILNNYKK